LRVVAISREFLLFIQGGCSKSLGPFFSEGQNDLPQEIDQSSKNRKEAVELHS
jgi:hypothetical protein